MNAAKLDQLIMKPGSITSGIKSAVVAFAIICAGVTSSMAQVAQVKEALAGAQKPAAEKPEEVRARFDQWLKESREDLARIDAEGASNALPPGISQTEVDDRRQDLEQVILTIPRLLKNLDSNAEAKRALEAAKNTNAAWTGFSEKPPYSILMVDELLNERDAIRAKLSSHESSLLNYEGLLSGTLGEMKAAEDAVSAALVAVRDGDATADGAAKWRLEAARIRSRLLACRAAMLKSARDNLVEWSAAAKMDLALTERKVRLAQSNASLNADDLERIGRISDDKKKAIHKEIEALEKRLKPAFIARRQAQAAVETLEASAGEPGKQVEGIEMAKYRVEVTQGRVEVMQLMIEHLESLVRLENMNFKAYQTRHAIVTAKNETEREKLRAALDATGDELKAWGNVLDSEIAACTADLSKLESRAASIASDDPRFDLLNEQRASHSEKLTMLQRIDQAATAQRKLIRRWIADHTPNPQEVTLVSRLGRLASDAPTIISRIWSLEVMSFEENVEVDGQTIKGRIPVTLGMLLRALMFFLIGYGVASFIAKRIQKSMVARGHIAEAQAKTLRNWAMIFVGLMLAISTLSILKIPLTVFAFFGGALAIGFGFGTQTLIKNFISGIIVLAERKVRVGDILDVEGVVGTVTEINTRSSVIRSADEVETVIPNSLFLENRVTNWTLTSSRVRRSIKVGVAYGTSPQKVMDILTQAASRHGLISKEPAPYAVFEDFGDNALVFSVYYWVDMSAGANSTVIGSDLRLMIEKNFTEAGIGVPFPQREMHLCTETPIEVRMVKGNAE
jgi:small-conductance mechanosensitive channel